MKKEMFDTLRNLKEAREDLNELIGKLTVKKNLYRKIENDYKAKREGLVKTVEDNIEELELVIEAQRSIITVYQKLFDDLKITERQQVEL